MHECTRVCVCVRVVWTQDLQAQESWSCPVTGLRSRICPALAVASLTGERRREGRRRRGENPHVRRGGARTRHRPPPTWPTGPLNPRATGFGGGWVPRRCPREQAPWPLSPREDAGRRRRLQARSGVLTRHLGLGVPGPRNPEEQTAVVHAARSLELVSGQPGRGRQAPEPRAVA